jgi:hypothetical protein
MTDEYPAEEAERRARDLAHRVLNTPKPERATTNRPARLAPQPSSAHPKASAIPPKAR